MSCKGGHELAFRPKARILKTWVAYYIKGVESERCRDLIFAPNRV
jgi:hypothetical protein